ncbi:hypothetical protein QQM39_43620 [Streptomyces sp. DT2A-34]|uniref:hypothetical protein n=1 Tax=Streptomyces sp. DT2A-34 TaxID=3051182 RepID=UPI00265BFE1E|nr:hypothetical protein [Streptomyces sp. DT2A-34]MDO0917445.1 hypothetical protein [Streptomyces sp. DT2A-34]
MAALSLAAYTGFRLPSLWSATLQTTSLADGFHRRFLVATVLYPLAEWAGNAYWFYAALSFGILALLLAVIVTTVVRATTPVRRWLPVAFLLHPAGGYLFHEVGYLDQVLFLLLFVALWLGCRGWWRTATLVMMLAPMAHEISALTVIPVWLLAVWRSSLPTRTAFAASILPVAVNALLFAVPPAVPGAREHLITRIGEGGWNWREDALALFFRTQAQSWSAYDPWNIALYLAPLVLAVIVVTAVVVGPGHDARGWVTRSLAVGASGAPFLLSFGGWDQHRWAFLLCVNLTIVAWVWCDGHENMKRAVVALGLGLMLIAHAPLHYFDGFTSVPLTGTAVMSYEEGAHPGPHGGPFDVPLRW